MSLVRWRPFERERFPLMEQMNRMWDDFMHFRGEPETELSAWSPAVNVYDKNGHLMVEAELPGVKKEDISVQVENGVLTLKGERKEEKEIKEKDYYRCERAYGSFSRSFSLPPGADDKHIEASYKDGVLILKVPKTEEAKEKSIAIS